MKKTSIFLIMVAMALAACGPKTSDDPIKNAICERVQAQTGEGTKLTFQTVELIDSCTFAKEIENRIKGFEVKYHQDSLYFADYKSKGSSHLYDKQKAMEKDLLYIDNLKGILKGLGDKANDIAYYDYAFSATGKTAEGAKVDMPEYYLCITPDGKVLSMVASKKTLHKGVGKVIPGYSEMFGDKEEAE